MRNCSCYYKVIRILFIELFFSPKLYFPKNRFYYHFRFNLFKTKKYHSNFKIREKENLEIILTEDFEFSILELKKLEQEFSKINFDLESGFYVLKKRHELKKVFEDFSLNTKKQISNQLAQLSYNSEI